MESIELIGQKSFVQSVQPFDLLSPEELKLLTSSIDIVYFNENDKILSRNTKPDFFYFVVKGVVKEIEEDGNNLYHSSKESFDASALLNDLVKHDFIAAEESICFTIPKVTFLKLIDSNPSLKSFYLQNLSDKIHSLIQKNVNKELGSFMVKKVKDSLVHPPLIVHEGVSIIDAVRIMTKNKSSCILVELSSEEELGIVTDTDLRTKVILNNKSYDDPIEGIASTGLISVEEEDFLFNAMLLMIEHSVKRLLVRRNGELVGIIEQIDLLGTMSHKPHLIDVRIKKSEYIDELKEVHEDLVYLVRSLLSTGVKVIHITRLLAELDMKLFAKLYELIAPHKLIENSCLIVLGSEGRKEQVLKTDQDNAIIVRDGYSFVGFREVCNSFSASLLDFGYPECPGKIMVNNPYWAKTLMEYEEELESWINHPSGPNMMNLAILLDARCMAGDSSLLADLKEFLHFKMEKNPVLLSWFAQPTLMFETPLSFFDHFKLGKNEHKDELDIKRGGIFPLVHGVRSLALEHQIPQTNTIERIKELKKLNVIDEKLADEVMEAFNFLLTVRLKGRIEKRDKGLPLDNYINPNMLPKLERDILRDCFKIVNQFKRFINLHFKLDMVK